MKMIDKSESCVPSIKVVLFSDWVVFLLFFGPVLFVGLGFVLYVIKEYPFLDYTLIEFLKIVFMFLISTIITWPLILWWCFVIRKTFEANINTEANITDYFGVSGPYIGIYYTFTFRDKSYNHTATLLNTRRARDIIKRKNVLIVFDERKNISFIWKAYC